MTPIYSMGHLPAPLQPLTPLIGRDQELAQVMGILARPEVRLLTLVGPGGTGKTRLALAAATASGVLNDEVTVVALAAISDPKLVADVIAETLGIVETGNTALETRLVERLSGRKRLLVLDNFEQIMDAAPMISRLLVACPELKALVTSREALHLYGEHEFPVPPMSLPDIVQLPDLESLTQYEAVRLFIERAVAVQPSFSVTNATAPAVAAICHKLDGLPLAIELAAARVKHMAPVALLARLERRLNILVGGARDLPPRHQTLRNAIAWSYDLLDAEEQAVFRGIGVFVDGFAPSIAETIVQEATGGRLLIDILTALVDKSLLRQEGGGPEARFRQLETIREYALEKLAESGDEARMRNAHMNGYLAFVEEMEPLLMGPDQIAVYGRLSQEHGNLRAALKWAVETGQIKSELRFCALLGRFWATRGHLTEGRVHIEEALRRGKDASPALRADVLNWAGSLALYQSDLQVARRKNTEALELRRGLGDLSATAASLNNLAMVEKHLGNPSGARTLLEEALRIRHELGDRKAMAIVTYNLGNIAREEGNIAEARKLHMECLALNRESGNIFNIANVLTVLGLDALDEGDFEAARMYQEESLELHRSAGNDWSIGTSLVKVGDIMRRTGDLVGAWGSYRESLSILKMLGDRGRMCEAIEGLALVLGMKGMPLKAAEGLAAVRNTREQIGWVPARADREHIAECSQRLMESVGQDAWEAASQAGEKLTLDEASNVMLNSYEEGENEPPSQPIEEGRNNAKQNYIDGLTAREIEVLRVLAGGGTNMEIAAQLHLSPNTVQSHLRTIFGKIGVNTRSAATRYAIERGIG